jgi:hypothetical protein
MKAIGWMLIAMMLVASALLQAAKAEIVHTQVNVSIPEGGYYNIDLNHDGITDFTLRSPFLQGLCESGDEFSWYLDIVPANGSGVATPLAQIGSVYAAALPYGASVDDRLIFISSSAVMAELYWGACGSGSAGLWLNVPDRYLGLQFRAPDNSIHYGWAKVTTADYVDQQGHFHSVTILTGYAYETVPGEPILAGQTAD